MKVAECCVVGGREVSWCTGGVYMYQCLMGSVRPNIGADTRDGRCTGIRTSPLIFSFSPAQPSGSVRPNGLGWARMVWWAPFR